MNENIMSISSQYLYEGKLQAAEQNKSSLIDFSPENTLFHNDISSLLLIDT